MDFGLRNASVVFFWFLGGVPKFSFILQDYVYLQSEGSFFAHLFKIFDGLPVEVTITGVAFMWMRHNSQLSAIGLSMGVWSREQVNFWNHLLKRTLLW